MKQLQYLLDLDNFDSLGVFVKYRRERYIKDISISWKLNSPIADREETHYCCISSSWNKHLYNSKRY